MTLKPLKNADFLSTKMNLSFMDETWLRFSNETFLPWDEPRGFSLLMWLLLICRGLVHVMRPAHVLNLLFWRLFHRLLFLQMQEFVPHLRSRLRMSIIWLLFPLIKITNPVFRHPDMYEERICLKGNSSSNQCEKECSFAATRLWTCRVFGDTQQLLT